MTLRVGSAIVQAVSVQNSLSRYVEAGLRLIYPSVCALCHQLLELEEKEVCPDCRSQIEKLKLFPSEERIRKNFAWGDEGWALFRYEGAVKEIFHQIKFSRRRDLVRIFSGPLAQMAARRPQLAGYDRIVGIPQDSRRRLEREFNQSALLAVILGKIVEKKPARALLEKSPTPPQSRLGREGRQWNVDRAFRIRRPGEAAGASILLVDDIFTTGATLEQAARALKEAGAKRVGYLVIARSLLN